MATTIEPFQGLPASTIGPFTATTTSANAPIDGLEGGGQIRILNTGSANCRIAFGKDNTAAVTVPTAGVKTGLTYAPTKGSKNTIAGSNEILSAPPGTKFIAFACDTGTTTMEFTPGQGL